MTATLELVEVLGHLRGASNTTLLARDADGALWVYKPAIGEQPLWDFPWRTLAAREVLTFRVSEAMGLGIVPETRAAVGALGEGSAQTFLDEDRSFDPRPLLRPVPRPELWPVAVLDLVTNQADRKLGHLLRDRSSDRLYAIDNGLTFHPEDKLRTVLWGFAGSRLPSPMVEALQRLAVELEASLCDEITDLLGRDEADAIARRTQRFIAHPVHPRPPTDRPTIPWPLW